MWHTHISAVLFVGVLRYDTMHILLCRKLTVSCGSPVRNLTFSDVPPALTHAVVWAHTWLLREPVPFVHTCSDLCWCCSGIFETKASLVWVTGETSVRPAGLAHGLPRSRHWQPPSVRSPAGSRAERGAGARRRSARLLWCDHESKPRRDRLVWGVFRKNASLQSRILDRWSTRTYCVA